MLVHIKAKPNSKQNRIIKVDENQFEIFLKNPPINGKANKELIKILSKYFNIPKNNIIITSGIKNKNKTIKIIETS